MHRRTLLGNELLVHQIVVQYWEDACLNTLDNCTKGMDLLIDTLVNHIEEMHTSLKTLVLY